MSVGSSLDGQLDRISEREPVVRAWAHHDPAWVRQEAAIAPHGLLAGVTLGVKDIFDTADMPTTYGAPAIYEDYRPRADAAAVALARAEGAVLMGKTVSTEMAFLTPGPTTNPHDHRRTPGGSSSGSAAAVADGMVRVALGTQTAGSVIRPASFCGIAGFKPSHGAVSIAGMHLLSPSLDTVGWMARSVDDLALVHHALTGRLVGEFDEPPRIGLYGGHHWEAIEASSRRAVTAAANSAADNGASGIAIPVWHDTRDLDAAHQIIMGYEAASAMTHDRLRNSDRLSEGFMAFLLEGARVSASDYDRARRATEVARDRMRRIFDQVDVLLTPAAMGEAPEGLGATGDPRCNRLWTLLGLPCVTIPGQVGPAGMPVGVQIVAGAGNDEMALAVANWLAALLPVPARPGASDVASPAR